MGGKKIFILGAGKSGAAAARLAASLGGEVFLYDDKQENAAEPRAEIDAADTVIVSPGVPPENELYRYAKNRGKTIKSEMEFAFDACEAPVVAITGTNGKTTTTALTEHLLSAGGLAAVAGGNIGRPFSDFATALTPENIAVVEVSSFMLETVLTFRPVVAALLNITPDHLDRHKTMEEYTVVKFAVFQNQTENDCAVLNLDDPIIAENAQNIKAEKYWFSAQRVPACRDGAAGAYLSDNKIYFGDEYVCDISAVKLAGRHNTENALAAVTIAKLFGVASADIERGLSTFKAVPHRLEFVAESRGIKFFNDSKATNIDGALKAAESTEGATVMILGGSDKGYEYDALFSGLPSRVTHCVFIGAVTEKLITAARRTGYKNFTVCGSLKEATERAARLCVNGGTVLLSPAAASFDMFRDYEHRGEVFKEIVYEYIKK